VSSQTDPPTVALTLIGDFAMRHNECRVEVAPNSQRLICFLALQRHPVRRAYVSGTLWCDSAEPKASASLRSALWRVPAPAGRPVVCASSTQIWLNPDVQVDLRAAISRATEVIDEHIDRAELVAVARELCALGDEVLVGWYDDWLILERERFRQLRLHALDRVGDGLLSAGRYYDALQVGLVAVAAEPLRESAHRLIVRTHLAEGNIAEAIHQYDTYAALLADELGARPSAAMTALRHEYLDAGGSPAALERKLNGAYRRATDRAGTPPATVAALG
jgi:DNA-binding SARP family transcriptional activator